MSDEFQTHCRKAEKHLLRKVPEFAPLIKAVGPCTLTPEPNVFLVTARSIVAQLISTAAAKTIFGRIEAKLKGRPTPANFAKLTEEELRSCGLSRAKARAMLELAEHFRDNRNFAKQLAAADDERARSMLLPLRGIGPWTVDMLLIFSLGRLDILPVGDFGLRAGVRDVYRLPDLPKPSKLIEIAEPWRPYRSLATWYLWRSRGVVPQSDGE